MKYSTFPPPANLSELRRPEMAIAVRSIIASNGNVRIGDLSERCCISVRQFERHFKTLTGFTPKTFARICRFNAVIALTRKPEGPLTDVAYRFGYYDQSHFIQDFKQFSGLTRVAILPARPPNFSNISANHVVFFQFCRYRPLYFGVKTISEVKTCPSKKMPQTA